MMKIKIWGVTCADTVYSRLYENVTKFEINPDKDYDDEEMEYSVLGFDVVIYQGKKKTTEHFSIHTTFEYKKEYKLLYINFNDY